MNVRAERLVLYSHNDTPYRSFGAAVEPAAPKAGLEDFTLHEMRHTRASCLAMVGVALPAMRALMGHHDIIIAPRDYVSYA